MGKLYYYGPLAPDNKKALYKWTRSYPKSKKEGKADVIISGHDFKVNQAEDIILCVGLDRYEKVHVTDGDILIEVFRDRDEYCVVVACIDRVYPGRKHTIIRIGQRTVYAIRDNVNHSIFNKPYGEALRIAMSRTRYEQESTPTMFQKMYQAVKCIGEHVFM